MSDLKAYTYRLYQKKQAEQLQGVLDHCRELYNSALQERRDAYEIMVKRHPNYFEETTRKFLTQAYALTYNQQATQLPEVKEIRPEYHESDGRREKDFREAEIKHAASHVRLGRYLGVRFSRGRSGSGGSGGRRGARLEIGVLLELFHPLFRLSVIHGLFEALDRSAQIGTDGAQALGAKNH